VADAFYRALKALLARHNLLNLEVEALDRQKTASTPSCLKCNSFLIQFYNFHISFPFSFLLIRLFLEKYYFDVLLVLRVPDLGPFSTSSIDACLFYFYVSILNSLFIAIGEKISIVMVDFLCKNDEDEATNLFLRKLSDTSDILFTVFTFKFLFPF